MMITMFRIELCDCGGIYIPHAGKFRCRSCGNEIRMTEEAKIIKEEKKKDIVVIEDNKPDLPTTDKECKKCSGKEAYYWLIQTRSSDEPPTQFFRCTSCKHVWREYK